MELDFSLLTAAQRRFVVRRYEDRPDDESVATLRVLVRMGWVHMQTLCLTPEGKRAYEYWLAWGDTHADPAGYTWVGGHKISRVFFNKLMRAQAQARYVIQCEKSI